MIKEIRYCKIEEFPSYYKFINEKDEEIYIYFNYIAGIIFFKTLFFRSEEKSLSIGKNNNFIMSIKKEKIIDEYEFTFNDEIKKEFKEIITESNVVVTEWYKKIIKLTNEINRINLKKFLNFYKELNKMGGD